MEIVLRRLLSLVALIIATQGAWAQLRIVKPNGGEIFYINRDRVITIEWDGIEDSLAVQIYVSSDDGTSWQQIADSAKGLSFQWNAASFPTSSGYRLRVQQVRPPQSADNITYARHFTNVLDGAWSPGGTRVVTAGAEPHVWDAETGATINVLSGHTDAVNTVDWSKDSLQIVSASDDNTSRLWDATSYQPIRTYNHPDVVREARFNASGAFFATYSRDDRARIFPTNGATATAQFSHPATVNDVAWSTDGDRIVTGSDDNLATIYNRTGGLGLKLRGHVQAGVLQAEFSPDGSIVATVGGDATVRLFNATNGRQRDSLIVTDEGVRCLAFSPDGTRLAVGMSDSTVVVWNVASPDSATIVRRWGGHTAAIADVAWNSTGTMLATASGDASVQVFNMQSLRQIRRLPHPGPINTVAWSPDDSRVMTTAVDAARIWRITSIVLQADTSDAPFSISPPPPAFARLRTTGDTVLIGERLQSELRLEATSFLALADIDSIAVTLRYNYTMIDLETRDMVASEVDSADMRSVTLKPVPLPLTEAILGLFTFRATLGTDSVTSLKVWNVRQIGTGPGISFDTASAPILVQGICREGGVPRLYNPNGGVLGIVAVRKGAMVDIDVTLPERSPATVTVVDMLGRIVMMDEATDAEQTARTMLRSIDATDLAAGQYLVSVSTLTDRRTIMVSKQ
jgi:WD40 repeat protein